MAMLKRMLADYGIEPQRFRLEWVSAGEGERWAQVVNGITEDVRKLGPARIKQFGATAPRILGAQDTHAHAGSRA
jgi:coenzyme F420-reducing hydrogenase delta subunit